MDQNSNYKILFIIQPDTLRIRASVATSLDFGREFRATLGLLCVAGAVKELEGVETELVDCSAEGFGYEQLAAKIKEARPNLVALSALTFSLLDVLKTARTAKEACPDTKVCLGGVHVNLFPKETLNLPVVDYIIHGEGEKPFRDMVLALKNGDEKTLETIEGVGCKNKDKVHLNGPGEIIKEMDLLPDPHYELLNLGKYSHILSDRGQSMSIQTSRGCPYKCSFCDIRMTKFRFKSPEKVVREIKELYEKGITDFFVIDDTITVHKERLKKICDLIVKENLNITFKISARVDHIDAEVLAILKKAGCNRISYGVESGNQRILDYLEKEVTLEQIQNTFRLTRQAGLQAFGYLIIGTPTETLSEMRQTINFSKNLDADYVSVSICTPYPKTELTSQMIKTGNMPADYWQEFAENPSENFKIRFWNKDFSDIELNRLQTKFLQEYYRRPGYILREISKVRSKAEFFRKVKIGLKVAGF